MIRLGVWETVLGTEWRGDGGSHLRITGPLDNRPDSLPGRGAVTVPSSCIFPVIEGHVVPFPCEVAIPPTGAREVYFPPRYAGFDHTTLWPMGGQQTKLQQRLHMCIRVWDFSLGFCCPSEGEHVLDCHRSKEKEETRGEDSSLNQPQRADSGGPEKSSWSVSWRFWVVSDTQRYCGINLRSFKNQ